MSKLASLVAIVLAFTAGIATGADTNTGAGSMSHTITIIDGDLIRPSALSMRAGDRLEFTNYSTRPMLLVFTEPDDAIDWVRCRLATGDAAPGLNAWPLDDPRVSAIVPPGRSTSSCSFGPGRYGFVIRPLARDVRSLDVTLGTKGIITVHQ